jgi:hypothetical protein
VAASGGAEPWPTCAHWQVSAAAARGAAGKRRALGAVRGACDPRPRAQHAGPWLSLVAPPTSDPEQDGSSQLDLRGPAVESLGVQRGTVLPRRTPKAQVLPTAPWEAGTAPQAPRTKSRSGGRGDVGDRCRCVSRVEKRMRPRAQRPGLHIFLT